MDLGYSENSETLLLSVRVLLTIVITGVRLEGAQ